MRCQRSVPAPPGLQSRAVGEPEPSGRPTWAEIDLAALRANLAWVRARSGSRRVVAVVKADAYGHGAAATARALAAEGCDAFAVATLAEATELRDAGVVEPILLLQGLHAPAEADAVEPESSFSYVSSWWLQRLLAKSPNDI